MRTTLAYIAATLLADAEYLLGWAVGAALANILGSEGVALWLAFIPAAMAGVATVFIADNVVLPGKCRPFTHVCAELADRVADWGGLEESEDDTRQGWS